jgi:CheY-like chemotaxis protein
MTVKGLIAPQVKPPPDRTPRGDILIIDDDPDIRALLRARLAAHGYRVRTAEDAVVAGHQVLEQAPDLIITDIRLPYMTGLEFVAALRNDPALAGIAVVFMTATDPSPELIEKLGGHALLQKPIPADRLYETVDRELELRHR